MEEIIRNQSEWNNLPKSFNEFILIKIESSSRIVVTSCPQNSSVVARGNSSVEARENSSVVARENSSVVAWENSSVVAWGRTSVQIFSPYVNVVLFVYAIAIVAKSLGRKMIKKKSKTSHIHVVEKLGWFEENGIKRTKKIVLYKKVSHDFKTQENTRNETLWEIGTTVNHPAWNPTQKECGEGKFHAVSRPYFGDEFRGRRGDRYIAVRIALEDLFEWPNPDYPHKIAFREGKVLYECDTFGKRL